MPTRAAPRISGSALAAAFEERNTRSRDLRQERHPGKRRHSVAERTQAAREREQAEQYQRQEERQRHLVRGAAEVEKPAAVRLEAGAAYVHRRTRPLPARESGEVALVLRLSGGLPCGIGRADARAAGADALVGSALDGGRDHVTAVRVFVEVRRQVVSRPAQLGVRVLLVELPVARAVANHLIGTGESGSRQRKRAERAENQEMSDHSVQLLGSLPKSNIVPGSHA